MNVNVASVVVLFVVVPAGVRAVAGGDKPVSIPKSIVADLSKDVTAPLNAFLAAVPDGSTVRFPRVTRYRIDGTVVLDGKNNLTIDGNGALFHAFDAGEDHDKKTSYVGWKKTRNRTRLVGRNGDPDHLFHERATRGCELASKFLPP